MDKPSVYIETSIVSYLAADPSRHPVTLRNQQLTHAWWNTHRERYALYTSDVVEQEVVQGNPWFAQRRLELVATLPLLSANRDVHSLAEEMRAGVPLPAQANTDALHIAMGAVYRLTYVLTWNCKHIANPKLHSRINQICTRSGWGMPVLCTPEQLMGGQP